MRFHAEVCGRTIIVHPSGSPTSPDVPLYTKENVGAGHGTGAPLDLRAGEGRRGDGSAYGARKPRWENGVPRPAAGDDAGATVFHGRPPGRSTWASAMTSGTLDCGNSTWRTRRGSHPTVSTRCTSRTGFQTRTTTCRRGHGVIDFDSFGQALDDIGFDGAWTIEVLATNHPGTVEDVAIELAAIRDRWVAEGMGNVK